MTKIKETRNQLRGRIRIRGYEIRAPQRNRRRRLARVERRLYHQSKEKLLSTVVEESISISRTEIGRGCARQFQRMSWKLSMIKSMWLGWRQCWLFDFVGDAWAVKDIKVQFSSAKGRILEYSQRFWAGWIWNSVLLALWRDFSGGLPSTQRFGWIGWVKRNYHSFCTRSHISVR